MTARVKALEPENTIDVLTNNFMADFYSAESEARYIKQYLDKAYRLGYEKAKQDALIEGKDKFDYSP